MTISRPKLYLSLAAIVILCIAVYVQGNYGHIFRGLAEGQQGKRTLRVEDLHNLPELRVGDVVLREGIGDDSLVISQVTKSQFSHIGIVINDNPIRIMHATTNDDLDNPNQVIISTLDHFVSYAYRIAVKRYPLSDESRLSISEDAMNYVGREFVFSPESKDSLYCTTLLLKMLEPHTELDVSFSYLNIPFMAGNYLYPQSFLDDQNSTLIYQN